MTQWVCEGQPTWNTAYLPITITAGHYFEWAPAFGDAMNANNNSYWIEYDLAVADNGCGAAWGGVGGFDNTGVAAPFGEIF